ncbi:MAG TPA: hypothetical protein VEK15_27025 [Vicinamibacteria bacterium]|nr:hypothetical protein [Vicinamibacteria bacterium]
MMIQRNLGAALCFVAMAGVLYAQRATELYIPLGESPELSERNTVIGTIEVVDADGRAIVVRSNGESFATDVTDETQIYLDKSKLREKNDYGAFEDLVEGARVEILYQVDERAAEGPARWIKVEVSPSRR